MGDLLFSLFHAVDFVLKFKDDAYAASYKEEGLDMIQIHQKVPVRWGIRRSRRQIRVTVTQIAAGNNQHNMGNAKNDAALSPGQKNNNNQTQYKVCHRTACNAAKKKINGGQEYVADDDYRDPGTEGIEAKAVGDIYQEGDQKRYSQNQKDQERIGPHEGPDNYGGGSEEYAA
jgi:hypothetical protein